MKKAVMRIYFHAFSTKDDPHHGLCPKGVDSWCYFQEQLALGIPPEKVVEKQKRSLSFQMPKEEERKVKAVFESLSSTGLLERCVRGLTQNKNESFHSKMWARARKTKFEGLHRISFVARSAILDHNCGYQRASLLTRLGMTSPGMMATLRFQDNERKRTGTPTAKKVKKREALSTKDYKPGGF